MSIIITGRTTLWQKCQAYLDLINHMLIFAVCIYITFMCWYIGPTARSWHTWLCTIGVCLYSNYDYIYIYINFSVYSDSNIQYQLLMAESILCFSSTNSWSIVHTRRTNKHVHWILQVVGAILSLAGCIIEYFDRRDHFHTVHGITGKVYCL